MYEACPTRSASARETRDRLNVIGAESRRGTRRARRLVRGAAALRHLPLADVLAPAIRLAERGFIVTPYLCDCVADAPQIWRAIPVSPHCSCRTDSRLRPARGSSRRDYAAKPAPDRGGGPAALYDGPLGALTDFMAAHGGIIHRPISPLTRSSRASRCAAPIAASRSSGRRRPPPSGVHIVQMLNILEGYDIGGLGFGSADAVHLLAEALKIAFADRAVATADPAFVDVPVDRLTAKAYADERRSGIDMERAQRWSAGLSAAGVRQHHACHRRRLPTATSSPPRRPSTACSAPARRFPAPAC